jgi:hypothetical protein
MFWSLYVIVIGNLFFGGCGQVVIALIIWCFVLCLVDASMLLSRRVPSRPYSKDWTGRFYDELYLEILFFFFSYVLVCHWCVLVHFWRLCIFISVRMCTSENGRLMSMVVTFIEVEIILVAASLRAEIEINTIFPLSKKMSTCWRIAWLVMCHPMAVRKYDWQCCVLYGIARNFII